MSRNPNKLSISDNPLDDICPVCKSNRYLNPSLQFLINPECYHKMCSTCVDRIFTSGPTSCPVPRCGKTLRKKGFHKAFFADLKVEEECDIRKRVGDVFNQKQDDFDTLRDWNEYLEKVEFLVFDLLKGNLKEKAQAERDLNKYRAENLAKIEENKRAGMAAVDQERRREMQEREAAKQLRIAIAREMEEEKLDVEAAKRNAIDRMANSNEDANAITRQAQKVILKKSSARRNLTDSSMGDSSVAGERDSGLTIRGLKKKLAPVAEKEYDPFGHIDLTPTRYVLQDHYENEYLAGFAKEPKHMTGGYSLHEYYGRSMFEAFSGLGVFVEDELASRTQPAATSTIGTKAGGDDVF